MKKLRKLDFEELTKSDLQKFIGGDDETDPNPYTTTYTTKLIGTTYNFDGQGHNQQDAVPDTGSKQDHYYDYI